ncbi:MAG: riboflavin synthase subunit alpha [Actinobacteria bacterium 13_1_20CM_2_65_11]|nr:MAG: riboflavin synthase subunit alpha [Chloroflexi bacterium 13_1_40CM_65_17]OLC68842.1 MAG: riboflavin synthase subunit alpha [Actinobacteria bacterium 13_1_40CM_4_65_12]OLD23353.1 MAG: riboflavin synthase subunit alpha [Chloroflexi bacterium 13_1_40CM_3_65_12]OLD50190.1 MAG: riboflavin synthase subunit alpha [Actinobacteria bacterium 13_1_40CM_2_65_8]OLE81056.1 MAG: riboflavin synthase subunit alpha [Actinobacteria bacterium 13_1_20CM_2_65_11]
MFTGIVSGVGKVVEAGPGRLGIQHGPTTKQLRPGGSVAVNGCCLTVVGKHGTAFYADVVPETLRRSNLGRLAEGRPVNLELPLAANGFLDGHLVQGHVDATARIKSVKTVARGSEVVIQLPPGLRSLVVEKGSIAVDGMSLTVAAVDRPAGTFKVALIPHTLAATIATGYSAGTLVNLEADVVARYVARNLRR